MWLIYLSVYNQALCLKPSMYECSYCSYFDYIVSHVNIGKLKKKFEKTLSFMGFLMCARLIRGKLLCQDLNQKCYILHGVDHVYQVFKSK